MQPIDLDREVFEGIKNAIADAVKNHLANYHRDTPLTKIIDRVLTKRAAELESIIDDALAQSFVGFRDSLRDAASHKLARVIMAKTEGEIEKRANELRSDPAFRARLTLAIDRAIKEV